MDYRVLLTNVFHPQFVTKRDTPYKFKLLITFCMGCLAWSVSRLGVEYVMMSLDEIIENQSPIHVVLAGHSPLHNPIDWGHFDFDTSDSQTRIKGSHGCLFSRIYIVRNRGIRTVELSISRKGSCVR